MYRQIAGKRRSPRRNSRRRNSKRKSRVFKRHSRISKRRSKCNRKSSRKSCKRKSKGEKKCSWVKRKSSGRRRHKAYCKRMSGGANDSKQKNALVMYFKKNISNNNVDIKMGGGEQLILTTELNHFEPLGKDFYKNFFKNFPNSWNDMSGFCIKYHDDVDNKFIKQIISDQNIKYTHCGTYNCVFEIKNPINIGGIDKNIALRVMKPYRNQEKIQNAVYSQELNGYNFCKILTNLQPINQSLKGLYDKYRNMNLFNKVSLYGDCFIEYKIADKWERCYKSLYGLIERVDKKEGALSPELNEFIHPDHTHALKYLREKNESPSDDEGPANAVLEKANKDKKKGDPHVTLKMIKDYERALDNYDDGFKSLKLAEEKVWLHHKKSVWDELTEKDSIILSIRLFTGVFVMFSYGYNHCDIKPENILVPNGDIGKTMFADFSFMTTGCPGPGVPLYTIRSTQTTDKNRDLISVLLVLYEFTIGGNYYQHPWPIKIYKSHYYYVCDSLKDKTNWIQLFENLKDRVVNTNYTPALDKTEKCRELLYHIVNTLGEGANYNTLEAATKAATEVTNKKFFGITHKKVKIIEKVGYIEKIIESYKKIGLDNLKIKLNEIGITDGGSEILTVEYLRNTLWPQTLAEQIDTVKECWPK